MAEEDAVIAAEHARRRAQERRDIAAEEALIAERFHYAHITGLVEDRASYLARVRAGSILATTSAHDLVVTIRPGYALLTGRSVITVVPGSPGRDVETLFTAIWERQDGGWKISAYASTPMTDPGG